MSDNEKTPVVLVKGHQADEEWEAFVQRVVDQFRAAGLLKDEKSGDTQ